MEPGYDPESNRPGLPDIISEYKIPILLGLVSAGCIVSSVVLLVKSIQITTPVKFISDTGEATAAASVSIVVDVEGAVMSPGTYRLGPASRVEDALNLAGGLSDDANVELVSKQINRAQRLSDGQKLYIPKNEIPDTSYNGNSQSQREETSYNESIGGIGGGEMAPVSINSSSQSKLESLSGIGPATASKIIAGRPYSSLTELVSRKVLGQKLFDKLAGSLSL